MMRRSRCTVEDPVTAKWTRKVMLFHYYSDREPREVVDEMSSFPSQNSYYCGCCVR